MTKGERVRFEMLQRVGDLGRYLSETFPPSSVAGQMFAIVDGATDRIRTHAACIASGQRDSPSKVAARGPVRRWMLVIVRTAKADARLTPGTKPTLAMPRQKSDAALLKSAHAFIVAVDAKYPRFLELGLPETFLTEFREAVACFEGVLADSRHARASVRAARAGMARAIADGLEAARRLDVIVPNTLRDDRQGLAMWARERRVVGGWSKRPRKLVTPPRSGTSK